MVVGLVVVVVVVGLVVVVVVVGLVVVVVVGLVVVVVVGGLVVVVVRAGAEDLCGRVVVGVVAAVPACTGTVVDATPEPLLWF